MCAFLFFDYLGLRFRLVTHSVEALRENVWGMSVGVLFTKG